MEGILPLKIFQSVFSSCIKAFLLQACNYGGWGRWGVGGLPCPFSKIKKSVLHLCIIFSIQNVVLRVSRGEKCKSFPCGAFFSCVFDKMFIEVPKFHETFPALNDKMFIKVPKFHKTSPALKNFWLRVCISFGNFLHPQTRSSHDFLAGGTGMLV